MDGSPTPVPPTRDLRLVGLVAAAGALGAGELAGGLLPAASSPLLAVATAVVEAAPPALTDAAIDALGRASTPLLEIVVAATVLVCGAWLGPRASSAPSRALAGVVALAAVPPALAWATGGPALGALLGSAIAAVVGLALLAWLGRRAAGLVGADAAEDAPPADSPRGLAASQRATLARRPLLRALGAVTGLGALGAVAGRWLLGRGAVDEAREAVRLPSPDGDRPAPPAGSTVAGASPALVANDDFYRIDVEVRAPRVDPATWRLRVTGRVERPLELTYDELVALATDEADVLLACVSNPVGGDLAGTARWQGVRLDDLLDRAGLAEGAEQVLGKAVGGFTAGFPVAALDGRDALVAVAMNGEPLPIAHGFPARLVVPGLYGYVSATKWLTEIALTPADVDGYWVPRGWAKDAPIKPSSRIDVPRDGARVDAGRVAVAGVAWAAVGEVAAVEVAVDDGPWRTARLEPSLGPYAWRQWVLDWDAEPGGHTLAVRAVGEDGQPQTAETAPPRPDGASGHHTIAVEVR